MTRQLTVEDLTAYFRLGRLDLSNPDVRRTVRRLLAGTPRLRAAVTGGELRTADVRLRSVLTSTEGTLTGVASAYGVPYRIAGGWERIEFPAFRQSIASQQGVVPVYYEHGVVSGKPWATAPIGIASVVERPDGLHATFTLFVDDVGDARAVWRAAKAGALRSLSIGYTPEVIEQTRTADGHPLDVVTRAELIEVSHVVRGANELAFLDAA